MKMALLNGCLLLVLLAACNSLTPTTFPQAELSPVTPLPSPPPPTASATAAFPTAIFSPTSPTPLPRDFWQKLPVIPERISDRIREIYRLGLSLGNDPHIFSRIGDCVSAAPAFLVGFDGNYNLGEYTYLQPAIDWYKGSFKRPSLAAKNGLNTAGLLTSLWTGEQCLKHESLLDCQYRLDRPGFAIITIGTNEAYYIHHNPASFEANMRILIEDTLDQGIIPILSTKADNFEGDHSINATIARLALEYELPLWNFWLAVQPLPDQGMIDPSHLNSVSYINFTDFSIPHSLEYGVQVHNLTALQMLFFLWQQLADPTQVDGAVTSTPVP